MWKFLSPAQNTLFLLSQYCDIKIQPAKKALAKAGAEFRIKQFHKVAKIDIDALIKKKMSKKLAKN